MWGLGRGEKASLVDFFLREVNETSYERSASVWRQKGAWSMEVGVYEPGALVSSPRDWSLDVMGEVLFPWMMDGSAEVKVHVVAILCLASNLDFLILRSTWFDDDVVYYKCDNRHLMRNII